MKVAIYGRKFEDDFIDHMQHVVSLLEENNIEITIFEPFSMFLEPRIQFDREYETFSKYEELVGEIKSLISIGGDGTLLDSVTYIRDSEIPILGINSGRLGFLSQVSPQEIKEAIQQILDRKYKIEQRSLIRLISPQGLFDEDNYALNELTVHKKDTSSMITIHVYLDDEYLNSYWADGLIISTPTGSTAYSLSCGGPILQPECNNFIITPISPHNLTVRPIVIPDNKRIKLKVQGRRKYFLATLDSRTSTIEADTELEIEKAPFSVSLLQPESQSFSETIRNKLMWGIDKRN